MHEPELSGTNKHKTIRMAEQISDLAREFKTPSFERGVCHSTAMEILNMHDLIEQMSDVLRECHAYIIIHASCGDSLRYDTALAAADKYMGGNS